MSADSGFWTEDWSSAWSPCSSSSCSLFSLAIVSGCNFELDGVESGNERISVDSCEVYWTSAGVAASSRIWLDEDVVAVDVEATVCFLFRAKNLVRNMLTGSYHITVVYFVVFFPVVTVKRSYRTQSILLFGVSLSLNIVLSAQV